jgi:glutamate carboxypeptidase
LAVVDANLEKMLDVLERFVQAESPSSEIAATRKCADVVSEVGALLLGAEPERIEVDGRPHLRWGSATPRVLLVGHLDTVWPLGTIERLPFSVTGGVARGPGSFDMKAGLVQGLFALRSIGSLDGIAFLINSDEELGSPTSKGLMKQSAHGARAALVLEPSADGALKIARKGVTSYRVTITGRAAHAGLEPESGRNALIELAHQVLALADLPSHDGATITPTLASAGTAANTVPPTASLTVDVRSPDQEIQDEIDRALMSLRPKTIDVTVDVERIAQSPPFPRNASEELFERAQRIARDLGIGDLEGAEVGGGSDGNYTASVGTPTLDGLGPVGDGAHAETEHVMVEEMPKRAALVAALVRDLLS